MKQAPLADKVLEGDVRATARLIRWIDDADPAALPHLAKLYRHTGRAHVIGFTGSPGVGKSTLVDKVVSQFRKENRTVGVLAIDPTSPFTGGAILGDRIRMQRHFLDEGVFIRSMATRGQFGGLTRSTADAVVVLDAMGKDVIIIETVGVGQDEVDIAHSAHTTALVTVPGMGDDIQAIKAGLMEIGDVFVVNKCDREGSGKTVRELRFMLHMSSDRHRETGWIPPIVETSASQDEGVENLHRALNEHRDFLMEHGKDEWKRRVFHRTQNQLLEILKERALERVLQKIGGPAALGKIIEDIVDRRSDPYGSADDLLRIVMGGDSI